MIILHTALLLSSLAVPSKVVKVVVFPDRAQVIRQQDVACGARAKVEFTGVTPAADGASFRATTSHGAIDGLRAESRTRVEAYSAEAQKLDDKITALDAQLVELRDNETREENALRLARELAGVATTLIGRELAEAANSKGWAQALQASVDARLASAAEQSKLSVKRRQLGREREELVIKRSALTQAGARHEWLVEVLTSCPAGQTAKVQLSYFVGGARWTPAYEARALDNDSSVELSTFATVVQTTGEDWTGSRLVLSTALPRQNATPPTLSELGVYADIREPPRKLLVSREGYRAHAETGGKEDKNLDGRLRVVNEGLSVQIEVPETVDVPGVGTPTRLFIGKSRLTSALRLRAAPRLMPFVFRVAEMTNEAPFPLLPGSIDVFRHGGLLARYELERVAAGARFTLTFGLEERVRIKRVVVAEVEREKSITGSLSRKRRFGYRLEVVSYLPATETVELVEQLPVSELDDVKVAIDPKTTQGYDFRATDGLVTWRQRLKSGEKQKLELHFSVDAPAKYDAGGT